MSIPPEKLRELVLVFLFGMTCYPENDSEELKEFVTHELRASGSAVARAFEMCEHICASLSLLDPMIAEFSHSYSMERIQEVERAILRLTFWELFIQKQTPQKVMLSEADRLTKKFAGPSAVSFVHAILTNACIKERKEPHATTDT